MSRGRNAAWQPPTPEQRELLRVVLLADFPNREAIAAHIGEIRVQPSCGCGCPSLNVRLPVPIDLVRQEWPVQLAGESTTGMGALVLLFAHGAQRFELEIAPVDNGDFGSLDPSTIRAYDRVVDASGAVTWVAREKALRGRAPTPPGPRPLTPPPFRAYTIAPCETPSLPPHS